MNSRVKYWLRWILALPVSSLISYGAYYFVIISLTGDMDRVSHSKFLAVLTEFASAFITVCVFTFSFSAIAPKPYQNAAFTVGAIISVFALVLITTYLIGQSSVRIPLLSGLLVGSISMIAYNISRIRVMRNDAAEYQKYLKEQHAKTQMPVATLEAMRGLYKSPNMTEEQAKAKLRAAKAWHDSQAE